MLDISKKVFNKKTHEIVTVIAVSEDKKHAILGSVNGNTMIQSGYALMENLEEIKDAEIILPKAKKPAKVKAQAPVSQSAEETDSKSVQ